MNFVLEVLILKDAQRQREFVVTISLLIVYLVKQEFPKMNIAKDFLIQMDV
jgi:hypothetical protein